MGWHINSKDFFAQAGLLLPMTLINLASLILLVSCFFIGKFEYKYSFDATNNVSLLTALVPEKKDGHVGWGNEVRYPQAQPQEGFRLVPRSPNEMA